MSQFLAPSIFPSSKTSFPVSAATSIVHYFVVMCQTFEKTSMNLLPSHCDSVWPTDVPDVGVQAHVFGGSLELQAAVGRCQLPATIRVPRQAGDGPLHLIGISEGKCEGWHTGKSQYWIRLVLGCTWGRWWSSQTAAPEFPLAPRLPPGAAGRYLWCCSAWCSGPWPYCHNDRSRQQL